MKQTSNSLVKHVFFDVWKSAKMLISMLVSLKSSNVFLVISPFYPTSGFNHHVAKEVELNKNWSPFGSLKLPKKIGGEIVKFIPTTIW